MCGRKQSVPFNSNSVCLSKQAPKKHAETKNRMSYLLLPLILSSLVIATIATRYPKVPAAMKTTLTVTVTSSHHGPPLQPHRIPPQSHQLRHRGPLLPPHHRYHPHHAHHLPLPQQPPQHNPIARDLADEFLTVHNSARRDANLPPLVWDAKLEQYAKQYAVQRGSTDCAELIHSHGPYGENIFWGGGSEWRPKDAVERWMHEGKFYDPDANDCKDGQMCGHYTQIVWRDSCRLGCALERCQNNDTFVVCSYDPPGNFVGEKPFLHYNN